MEADLIFNEIHKVPNNVLSHGMGDRLYCRMNGFIKKIMFFIFLNI